jgi:hypothetical protein
MEYWSVANYHKSTVTRCTNLIFNIWGLSVANCVIPLISNVEIEIDFPQGNRRLKRIVSGMGDVPVKQAVQSN